MDIADNRARQPFAGRIGLRSIGYRADGGVPPAPAYSSTLSRSPPFEFNALPQSEVGPVAAAAHRPAAHHEQTSGPAHAMAIGFLRPRTDPIPRPNCALPPPSGRASERAAFTIGDAHGIGPILP